MKHMKKMSFAALAAAMMAAPAVNAFAAPEDIIDTSKVASLTLHKYDITAAKEDGVDVSTFVANGKKNADAETALQRYTIEGAQFSYVRVGSINTESVAGEIKVLYDVPRELQTILNLTDTRGDSKFTSTQINDALVTALTDTTKVKNQLEAYIAATPGNDKMPLTDANGLSKVNNLPLGLYLLVETTVPANVNTTVDPFFVSLPMTDLEGSAWFYDVDVYPKNQTNIPDLDKTVRQHDDAELYHQPEYKDTATVSEGDRADYLLVSHLPKITSAATYLTKYTFEDTLAKGLKYNKDAAIYFYDNETDAQQNNIANAVAKWEQGSERFSASYTETDALSTATIEMTDDGLRAINESVDGQEASVYSERWMVVSYSATVNSDSTVTLGDKGNQNDVTLTWRRSNMNKEDHLKDRSRVYSYGIDLKKTFQNGANAPVGDPTKVQFSLKNSSDEHYIVAQNDAPGVYHVTDATKGAAEENGTVFSPAADGTLIINGLEANDYILTELHTDAGYNLLKEPITISIKATQDEFTPTKTTLYDSEDIANNPNKEVIELNKDRASATVDTKATNMKNSTTVPTSTNAYVEMSVVNTPGFGLPATGGTGTIVCTVAGCTVAFAGVALATKKSKKDQK